MVKIYQIPVTWTLHGCIEVRAASLKDAIEQVREDQPQFPEDTENYMDVDIKESKRLNNKADRWRKKSRGKK